MTYFVEAVVDDAVEDAVDGVELTLLSCGKVLLKCCGRGGDAGPLNHSRNKRASSLIRELRTPTPGTHTTARVPALPPWPPPPTRRRERMG